VLEDLRAGINCLFSQGLFDAQQFVPLHRAFGARNRADFKLSGISCDSQVDDGRVFCLARARRDHGQVAGVLGLLNRVQSLGDGADLVHLDEHGVGDLLIDAALDAFRVGGKHVVANQLHLAAQLIGKRLPARPIVFGHAIFDGDDRVLPHPFRQQFRELLAIAFPALDRETILSVLVEMAGGDVERDGYIFSRSVPGFLDAFDQQVEALDIAIERRPEAAFVGDGYRFAMRTENRFGPVINVGHHLDSLAVGARAHRDHQEILDIDAHVGMHPAADDLHLWHRQSLGVGAAEIAIERHAAGIGRRPCGRH